MLNSNSALRCYARKETNPYHHKLQQFDNFVFLDDQAEKFKGHWNNSIFNNSAPIIVEIGVGYGDFMVNYCQHNPEKNYVGMVIAFCFFKKI